MNPQLTYQQILDSQHAILADLLEHRGPLEAIRVSGDTLIEKWQALLAIVIPAQIRVATTYGFEGDQAGLSAFNEQLMAHTENDQALQRVNRQKWELLLQHAFGTQQLKPLSLDQAQNLTEEIAHSMTSESCLTEVDQLSQTFEPTLTLTEKRQQLLTLLFPCLLSAMERYGFEGEIGFVQAQAALHDHYQDPIVKGHFQRAQQVFFGRAGLID